MLNVGTVGSFRLLMELYSFLPDKDENFSRKIREVSVSLWSYIHSYLEKWEAMNKRVNRVLFPSPYGVIFILTCLIKNTLLENHFLKVSVSLWSYIHSYPESKGFIH